MQKSKIQEMFPINRNRLWRIKFWEWCITSIVLALISVVAIENLCNLKVSVGLGIGAIGALFFVVGYWYANRFVKNYFLDVTDESVILGPKKILFKDILDIYVFQDYWSGGYGLRSTLKYAPKNKENRNSASREGAVMVFIPDLGPLNTHAIFDKATAFALKAYILEKMRNAQA
jgi:hypothetical protein